MKFKMYMKATCFVAGLLLSAALTSCGHTENLPADICCSSAFPPIDSETDSSLSIDESSTFQQENFLNYFSDFVRFFHTPVNSPAELPKDYDYAYFLLYEAVQQQSAVGTAYNMDADGFMLVPFEELAKIAKNLLNEPGLIYADMIEWPFPESGNTDYAKFSTETELPYATVENFAIEFIDGVIIVKADIQTSIAYDDAEAPASSYIYRFQYIHGEQEIYQLLSIEELK